MSGKHDILSLSWCEIVFTDKNKDYGAYDLRKRYAKNVFLGCVLAILIFALSVSSPLIIKLISGSSADDDNIKIVSEVELTAPPPIDKTEPPPPPVEPPPPLKTTIKFVAPTIVKDEEVTEEPPPSQEELKEVEAGAKTEQGDSTGIDLSLLDPVNEVVDEEATKIFTIVEQMPGFPGGEGELLKYLASKIKYPPMAKENGIEGVVFLTFVVTREGKVSDVKLLRGIGGGCDEEAKRVVASMPDWKPGKQNGRPVMVQYNLPVRFRLK